AVGARRRGVGAGRPRAGRTGRRGRGRVPHGRLPARASGAHRAAAIGAAVGGDPATAGRSARDRRRASVTPSPRATVLGALDPASALAWDEAIARSPLDRPTLLLWRTQPAVVIGRLQRADWEVDAGPRGGDLQGRPRPAPSRPDSVANVAGDGWESAMIEAFGAEPGDLDAATEPAMRLLRSQKYHDPAWHAGSWSSVTAPHVRALLGPATSA